MTDLSQTEEIVLAIEQHLAEQKEVPFRHYTPGLGQLEGVDLAETPNALRHRQPPPRVNPRLVGPAKFGAGGRRPSLSPSRMSAPQPNIEPDPLVKDAALLENIPRQITVNRPVTVEARIGATVRADLGLGLAGDVHEHQIVATPAMTVQLQAPSGGFAIDVLSRETQWVDNSHGQQLGLVHSPSFGQWQWRVTPLQRGSGELVLVVAARISDHQGVVADSPLPDQRIPVQVAINYHHTATSVVKWAAVAALGGIVAELGPQAVKLITEAIG